MSAMKFLSILAIATVFSASARVLGDEVDEIIAGDKAPPGVVFEIVSGDADLLDELLPRMRNKIERLRRRFPGLDIAIVSHGEEQFALTRSNQESEPKLHDLAENLVEEQQVSLHVCGTYAQWHGVEAEEFPGFVDVSATGPAQINDYRALGYILITLP